MAYAKTTISQILAQLGIGVGCATLFYQSFVRKDPLTTLQDHLEHREKENKQKIPDVVDLIDQEASRNTSGKIWGLRRSGKATGETCDESRY